MSEKRKKSVPKTIAALISSAIIGFTVTYNSMNNSLEKKLEKTVEDIKDQFPMQIDQFTRVDSASVIPPSTLQYYFTLTQEEKATIELDTIKKYLKPKVIENIKTNPEMEDLKKNKVTLGYQYHDKNGDSVYTLMVTPDMYKETE